MYYFLGVMGCGSDKDGGTSDGSVINNADELYAIRDFSGELYYKFLKYYDYATE